MTYTEYCHTDRSDSTESVNDGHVTSEVNLNQSSRVDAIRAEESIISNETSIHPAEQVETINYLYIN